MKYLILILILFTSCTDNKKEQETMIEVNTNTISQETNTIPEPPKSIELSYDKGLDLILVDTSFDDAIYNITKEMGENFQYYAIYWDSNNNQYYTIENDTALIYPTSITNSHFIYTIDETKQYEPVFDSSLKEIFSNTKSPLLYIGSISPLERIYLDPTNQNYYTKKLTPWNDFIFTYTDENSIVNTEEETYTNRTDSTILIITNITYLEVTNTNILPLYPYLDKVNISYDDTKILGISFTNSNHEIFSHYSYGQPLLYKGKITNNSN